VTGAPPLLNMTERRDMNRQVNNGLRAALVLLVLAACRPQVPSQAEATSGVSNDAVASKGTTMTESGYANVNDLRMYYEVHGAGKPIVLLHGSYMNIPMNWSQFIPLLAKERKVIVTELQGHGRTKDIAREFSYEALADDVSGLLQHLKIESADVLGYSMGGGVAFQAAAKWVTSTGCPSLVWPFSRARPISG
jgi:hypothetical protein